MSVASTGIAETERSAYEELERIEQAIADRISYNPYILPPGSKLSTSSSLHGKRKRPVRDNLLHEHEVARMLDRYQAQSRYLKEAHDPESEFKTTKDAELAKVGPPKFQNQYDEFTRQVAEIRKYHQNYPNEPVENLEALFKMKRSVKLEQRQLAAEADATLDAGGEESSLSLGGNGASDGNSDRVDRLLSSFSADLNVDAMFSGEEFYGRYLDLVSFHDQFLNLKFVTRQFPYLQYLGIFAEFENELIYSPARLRDPQYPGYISSLHQYLAQFVRKTRPLENPSATLDAIDREFESSWASQSIPWVKASSSSGNSSNSADGAVAEDGTVWCESCAKSFKNLAVYNGHLNGNKHKKNVKAREQLHGATAEAVVGAATESSDNGGRTIVLHEFAVKSIVEFLAKQVNETKGNVERKQALTDQERLLEVRALEEETYGTGDRSDEENDGHSDDDNDDDDVIYNPLKLPLGWDGKPIPFWLFKLNGLGIEYPCEICGNYIYKGRKDYEKHFLEARHVHGLKCLGIEPSGLFRGITDIKDALKLWEKVRKDKRVQESRSENVVEMEDTEGNVMSAKVYTDLKKQGLL